jgi:hypothetical protein
MVRIPGLVVVHWGEVKESSFSEEKEAKRLLSLLSRTWRQTCAMGLLLPYVFIASKKS